MKNVVCIVDLSPNSYMAGSSGWLLSGTFGLIDLKKKRESIEISPLVIAYHLVYRFL